MKNEKKKWYISCSGPVSNYRPVQSDFVGTMSVRPVFFPVQNRGVERTGLLAGTVYSSRTGRYSTKSITLVDMSLVFIVVVYTIVVDMSLASCILYTQCHYYWSVARIGQQLIHNMSPIYYKLMLDMIIFSYNMSPICYVLI